VVEYATQHGVTVALEPEPGMLVETLDDWAMLRPHLPGLTLALDLGHCLVTGEREPAAAVAEFAPHLGPAAIEDMRAATHPPALREGDWTSPPASTRWRRSASRASSASSSRARAIAPTG
jgi:ribosomal protein S12 methylthiotransferase accessory factor